MSQFYREVLIMVWMRYGLEEEAIRYEPGDYRFQKAYCWSVNFLSKHSL